MDSPKWGKSWTDGVCDIGMFNLRDALMEWTLFRIVIGKVLSSLFSAVQGQWSLDRTLITTLSSTLAAAINLRVMRLMEPMLLHFLKPYQPRSKLQIRVCRTWVTKSIRDDPQPTGLDCVVVDKQGDAIHVTTNARDIQYFLDHLTVDDAYEINKYRVVHNRASNKVVPHATIIELNRKTIIVPIQKTRQEIPMQWFNLIELEQLYERIDRDVELTYIFSCLMAVQLIENVTIQRTRIAKKRNLNLENIRGETVRVTLWGEAVTSFEDSGIQSLPPPIFVALTSLKVKQYQGKPVLGSTGSTVYFINLDIPQHSEYRRKMKVSHAKRLLLDLIWARTSDTSHVHPAIKL
ncbi:uncharacterized protein [Malus domestica]|uniref:uncharacterized protein n=1 Tax=Malus domestica TaxID=3750 RepID=UPI003975BF69